MQKLIFRWDKNEICLSDTKPIILSSLDLGEVYREDLTNKAWGGFGVSVVSSFLGARVIRAACTLLCENEKELFNMRRKVASVFNPSKDGTLFYFNGFKEYEISAAVEASVVFEDFLAGRRGQFFKVKFFCKNPLFTQILEKRKDFLETVPAFKFPVSMAERFVFSTLSGGEISVFNNGDAKSPIRIEIFGPCKNPVILNQTTNELIKLDYELLEGEKAIITTNFSDKKVFVYKNDTESFNAFHFINPQTVFFSLVPGENRLRFYSDLGYERALCRVFFREGYFAV